MALNANQQRFVEEYLIDLNAAQAAIRAGYSPHRSHVQGAKLLANPSIAEAIRIAKDARSVKTGITAERVLRELAAVGLSDIGEIMDFSGPVPKLKTPESISEVARRSISAVKVKRYMEGHGDDAREVEVTEFRLWDKVSALEKIGKHLNMFIDRLEVTGAVPTRIIEEVATETPQRDPDAKGPLIIEESDGKPSASADGPR